MTYAVRFDNVSKRYELGARQATLRSLFTNAFKRGNGNGSQDNILWALKDVSFELPKGQALGLIGPNGAGKSTALKLLANITQPTSGNIEINGRIASLIELGAGFHIDLTGRENVYLNAAILGMPLKRTTQIFDEIVAFSGLERFIDTPVKRYSSGMYVRLGFAIAAHVEPDIFLVDEVLAVGDSEFRQKCTTRIAELQKKGTTIIFVSHNLFLVKSVCDKGILLGNGQVQAYGNVVDVINKYERWVHERRIAKAEKGTNDKFTLDGRSSIDIGAVTIQGVDGKSANDLAYNDAVEITVSYVAHKPIANPNLVLHIVRADGPTACMIRTSEMGYRLDDLEGKGEIKIVIDPLQLVGGGYVVEARILGSMDVGLARGMSSWFQVSGLSLSTRERGGVFVPRVASAVTHPLDGS